MSPRKLIAFVLVLVAGSALQAAIAGRPDPDPASLAHTSVRQVLGPTAYDETESRHAFAGLVPGILGLATIGLAVVLGDER